MSKVWLIISGIASGFVGGFSIYKLNKMNKAERLEIQDRIISDALMSLKEEDFEGGTVYKFPIFIENKPVILQVSFFRYKKIFAGAEWTYKAVAIDGKYGVIIDLT